jgi:branched-chain amino acid aminotransferase
MNPRTPENDILVWTDGEVRRGGRARLSALDRGLTTGDGVFETLKVVARTPFALTRHIDRLHRSARALGLPRAKDSELRRATAALTECCEPDRLYRLRVVQTAGEIAADFSRQHVDASLFLILAEMAAWDSPTSLATAPWPRNEQGATSGIKTTSYAENVIALDYAHKEGAEEALLVNTGGFVAEGTGSNVFVVAKGELLTPSLDSGCLAGITRQLVIEWCGAKESAIRPELLEDADEVFITSSTRDVRPVAVVDGRAIPAAPGAVTRRVMRTFRDRSLANPDP